MGKVSGVVEAKQQLDTTLEKMESDFSSINTNTDVANSTARVDPETASQSETVNSSAELDSDELDESTEVRSRSAKVRKRRGALKVRKHRGALKECETTKVCRSPSQ